MPSFYNGRRFFLTYAQCSYSSSELLTFLCTRAQVTYYVIAEEKHEDGSPHLHACVEFEAIQRRDVRWLDFNGHHPNKQDPRKWAACKQYCKKDGCFIETPEVAVDEALARIDLELECSAFTRKIDWLSWCVSNKLQSGYADLAWREVHANFNTIHGDEHIGAMCSALREFKFDSDIHTCLILIGPSGCGKTTWAKCQMPKPCLFVSHIDDLKGFLPGYHVSIIFDDVSFCHYPRTAQIGIVDFHNPRSIHCRYGNASIPAGVHKVFTCNEIPLTLDDSAIRRRIQVRNVIL